jgi:hypothetical protein
MSDYMRILGTILTLWVAWDILGPFILGFISAIFNDGEPL